MASLAAASTILAALDLFTVAEMSASDRLRSMAIIEQRILSRVSNSFAVFFLQKY